jgi:hypothetical protein
VCEQHKHGSVGAGAGNRPGYPTARRASRSGARNRRAASVHRPAIGQCTAPASVQEQQPSSRYSYPCRASATSGASVVVQSDSGAGVTRPRRSSCATSCRRPPRRALRPPTADDRAGLRRRQVQPPRRPVLTSRPSRRPRRMAADHRHRQPAQALAAHQRPRRRPDGRPRTRFARSRGSALHDERRSPPTLTQQPAWVDHAAWGAVAGTAFACAAPGAPRCAAGPRAADLGLAPGLSALLVLP